MQIIIHGRDFNLTQGIRDHALTRLKFALNWAKHQVRKISVRLGDVNGPRGGEDKRCSIELVMANGHNIIVTDTRADLYTAIDRAARRLAHSVARRLQKKRVHRYE